MLKHFRWLSISLYAPGNTDKLETWCLFGYPDFDWNEMNPGKSKIKKINKYVLKGFSLGSAFYFPWLQAKTDTTKLFGNK